MKTIHIKKELVDRIVSLNKKQKFQLSADIDKVDWNTLKVEIQKDVDKIKKSAKVYEILAYSMMAIVAIGIIIKLFGINDGPDLNKGALFIFLTVTSMFSAFSQRLRIERLEKQVLLLDMLEMVDDVTADPVTLQGLFT